MGHLGLWLYADCLQKIEKANQMEKRQAGEEIGVFERRECVCANVGRKSGAEENVKY